MIALLNPASFILGLVAWTLPVISLIRNKKNLSHHTVIFSTLSLSSCAISLYFQLLYTNHLVNISDWTAMMDTMGATLFAASVLLIITIILNLLLMLTSHKKTNH